MTKNVYMHGMTVWSGVFAFAMHSIPNAAIFLGLTGLHLYNAYNNR